MDTPYRGAHTKVKNDGLEKAHGLIVVAHKHTFGLLIVSQRHFVCLAADARLLVAPKGRMCWIDVKAVGPDTTGFNAPTHFIGDRKSTRLDSSHGSRSYDV